MATERTPHSVTGPNRLTVVLEIGIALVAGSAAGLGPCRCAGKDRSAARPHPRRAWSRRAPANLIGLAQSPTVGL